jgi:hypothetical protein
LDERELLDWGNWKSRSILVPATGEDSALRHSINGSIRHGHFLGCVIASGDSDYPMLIADQMLEQENFAIWVFDRIIERREPLYRL